MTDFLNPNLAQLAAYRAPLPRSGSKLDAMENPYGLPAELQPAWAQRLAQVAMHRYPDAAARELSTALQSRLNLPTDWSLMLGNGSDELIQLLCLAVARPGAVVLAPDPSFVMYRHLALACSLRFEGVPLQADFSLDLGAFLATIERTQPALIFLAQPNNPTGNLFAIEAITAICEAAPGWVVLDEAYVAYAGGDASALAQRYERVLVLRTLSKWGLAGLRLGYLLGPSHWLAEIDKLRLPYNVNVLSQAAGLFALEHAAVFDQQVAEICQQRAWLAQALAQLPATTVFPSAANFLLVRQSSVQAQKVYAALAAEQIWIKNLDGAHPALQGCLRPSLGTPQENQQLVAVWRDCLAA